MPRPEMTAQVNNEKNRRWIFAILTAVLFPIMILHGTCIAVMGPGTWGSGLEEVLPEFERPSPEVRLLAAELESTRVEEAVVDVADVPGQVQWADVAGDRRLYLTEESGAGSKQQRLFAREEGGIREIPLPENFVADRPRWMDSSIVCERWRPWAIPPGQKLTRYLASWLDPRLRPEVALYEFQSGSNDWHYLMPGHSLVVAPSAKRGALLRSGALLAGYFGILVWDFETDRAKTILSLREHGELGRRSFELRWSKDSSALQIVGRTAGFERKGSRGGDPDGIAINLLYLVDDQAFYDLNSQD